MDTVTKLTVEQGLEYWRAALLEEFGVRLRTDDRRWLGARLYEIRKTYGEPELENLMIFLPAPQDELWIVKKATEI